MNNTMKTILARIDESTFKDVDWLYKLTIDGLSVNRNSQEVARVLTEAPINSDVHYYATKLLELPLQTNASKWDVDDLTMTGASSQYLNSVEHFWGSYVHYLNALILISEMYNGEHAMTAEMVEYIPHMAKVGGTVIMSAKDFSGLLTTCEDRKNYTLELKAYCSAIDHARELVTTWLATSPYLDECSWLVSRMCNCGWTVDKHQERSTCTRCGTQPAALDVVIRTGVTMEIPQEEVVGGAEADVIDINDANNGATDTAADQKPYYKSIDSLILSDSIYTIYNDLSIKPEDMRRARERLNEVDCPPAVNTEMEIELIGLLGEYANVLGSSRDLLFITQAQHEWCVSYTQWIRKALDVRVTQLLA